MYVCGMTVYDFCHLGHARVMVVFDMVARWLRASGLDVTYVRNITDIDDKIIQRAQENGETIRQLTDRFIAAMHEDADAPRRAAPRPRAARHRLRRADAGADPAPGSTRASPTPPPTATCTTGCASSRATASCAGKLDDLKHRRAHRGRRRPRKIRSTSCCGRAPRPGEREVKWASPWGEGRPGWHIECSVMSTCCSASTSTSTAAARTCSSRTTRTRSPSREARTATPSSMYWMHNGFVRVDDEKMSKIARQLLHHPRGAAEVRPRGGALLHPACAVPQRAELLRRASGRRPQRAHPPVHRAQERAGRRAMPAGGLGRGVRAALPRGDGRRLQHRRGGGGAVRAGQRGQPQRLAGARRAVEGARRRARPARSRAAGLPAGRCAGSRAGWTPTRSRRRSPNAPRPRRRRTSPRPTASAPS